MSCCAYCGLPATTRIVANPEQVCLEHALEFWTGLLAYSRDRSGTCVSHERLCACPLCEELAASQRRAAAIAAAGPSPADHEHPQLRLVS
jgi:hypothetical protein